MTRHTEHRTRLCPECEIPQRARNHYFTGKLLVERDFTDEQRFFLGKERRHNRRLHGWGTVCGLEVRQHPEPSCRDRFVVVDPGTAVDCCGREIRIDCPETFDFHARFLELWHEAHPEAACDDEPGDEPHRLQVCVRYRECPAEDVPVLFDDCAGADEPCQPNRIVEGFELDLLLDPEMALAGPVGRELAWHGMLHVAGATAVAVHDPSRRIYVVRGAEPATLYALSAHTEAILASRALDGREGLDVAVSDDGTRVYLASRSATDAGQPAEVLVLDAADLDGDPVRAVTVEGTDAGAGIRLAPAPDGRLFAVLPNRDELLWWGDELNSPPADGDPPLLPAAAPSGSTPSDVAVTPDGEDVAVTNRGDGTVTIYAAEDPADASLARTVALPAGSQPAALAAASQADGDSLAVIDRAAEALHLVLLADDTGTDPRVATLGEPLAFAPLAVALSPGGRWAYVLEEDADGNGYLQAVDAHRVERELADAVGTPKEIGDRPRDLALGTEGGRLYAAWEGALDDAGAPVEGSGGVAVLEAFEEHCELVLGPCPGCEDGGECVVLATIEGYVAGESLVDLPADGGEAGDGEAAIDNRRGRRLLPSVEALAEVVRCLAARGDGEPGEQGPPGDDGKGIDHLDAQIVDCEDPPVAELAEDPGTGERTLVLRVPRGCDGEDGEDGEDGAGITDVVVHPVPCGEPGSGKVEGGTLELYIPTSCATDLTHICGISWLHFGEYGPSPRPDDQPRVPFNDSRRPGLLVAFDHRVRSEDISVFSFRVYQLRPREEAPVTLFDWAQYYGDTRGVQLDLEEEAGRCKIVGLRDENPDDDLVNGALYLPGLPAIGGDFVHPVENSFFRIEIEGDLIRDAEGQAVDADHLPPWLPDRPTGDGIPGGRFESYFSTIPIRPGINEGTARELVQHTDISDSLAQKIVAERERGGDFTDLDDLQRRVVGVGPRVRDQIREGLRAPTGGLDFLLKAKPGGKQ